MNSTLPKHILSAIRCNATSLGDHPALPPEDESPFLEKLLTQYYAQVAPAENCSSSIADLRSELGKTLAQCRKIESKHRQDLEDLVKSTVNTVLGDPGDSVAVTVELKNTVSVDDERMFPEPTPDYTFEDLEDIRQLTKEIYKRRFLNVIVSGAAATCAESIEQYLSELFAIDSDLPALYKKAATLNNQLLYLVDDTKSKTNPTTVSGRVSVGLGGHKANIHAEGVTFPALLHELFKGMFELAIAHGLPKDRAKAEYVSKKADFRLAEVWDLRMGLPMWHRIIDCIQDAGHDPAQVGYMHILMELSRMGPDDFNPFMQEVLIGTRKGRSIMDDLMNEIEHMRGQDEFDSFMQQRSAEVDQSADNEYFSPDELFDPNVEMN